MQRPMKIYFPEPAPRRKLGAYVRSGSDAMLRTGDQYRDSIRDGREVWIDGERVADVTTHPAFKPIVDVRARLYDMAHEARYAGLMTYRTDGGDACSPVTKPPHTQQDWPE